MQALFYSLLAALSVSAISLIGILVIGTSKKKLEAVLFYLVSFSAGSLLGGAFFHLLPEALEDADALGVFEVVLVGFLLFFVLERVLRWRHCHKIDCDTHKILGYQNLAGDGIHNFIDGLIIISAFFVDVSLGFAVTLSVILHEIPQEIGDFGVLLYSGFSKMKAIVFNLLSALLSIVGVLVGFVLITRIESVVGLLLPFAAGGFLYIAASDLIPELHREKDVKKSLIASIFFALAILFMLILKVSE